MRQLATHYFWSDLRKLLFMQILQMLELSHYKQFVILVKTFYTFVICCVWLILILGKKIRTILRTDIISDSQIFEITSIIALHT